jgi:hypothetical protein
MEGSEIVLLEFLRPVETTDIFFAVKGLWTFLHDAVVKPVFRGLC